MRADAPPHFQKAAAHLLEKRKAGLDAHAHHWHD
jgi:hypothetical protein